MATTINWIHPSRETWQLVVNVFTLFPAISFAQWFVNWYGQGKTSVVSKFNLPGRIAWMTMEVPGFICLLYCMNTITEGGINGLPWENKVLGGLFTIHYIYRSIIFALAAPSISPIHVNVWLGAIMFQVMNGISIGGWLGGYGPTTRADWLIHGQNYIVGGRMELGLMFWFLGFIGNIWHDEELREIRRASARNQRKRAEQAEKSTGKNKAKISVDKVYMIPQNGFFEYVLYPQYLFEWIEWAGFWCMTGFHCAPARNFLVNEISTMLPRAVQGKRWYIEKFGKEKIGNKKAVIPGLI